MSMLDSVKPYKVVFKWYLIEYYMVFLTK